MNTAENSTTDPSAPDPVTTGFGNTIHAPAEPVPGADAPAEPEPAVVEPASQNPAEPAIAESAEPPVTESADIAAVAERSELPTSVAAVDESRREAPVAESADAVTVEPQAAQPAPVADDVLLAAVDVAREALLAVTPASTVGKPAGHIVEGDHVLSLLFASTLPGYPGWNWSVTLARVDGGAPQVLETEMMPGEAALLAPEWVPWSDRLADYRASQEAAELQSRILAEAAAELELDDDEEDDDEFSILHAGDVDGVDVDEIDESGLDGVDSDDDDEDDSDDENDDDDDENDDDENDDDDSDDSDDDDSDDDDDEEEDDDENDDEGDRTY